MKLHIYDAATGQILSSSEANSVLPMPEGLACMLIDSPYGGPTTHYVESMQLVEFPPKPSIDHVWNWTVHAWQVNLDDAKARVVRAAKAERDRRINGGFVWDGSTFDSDQTAQTRILGLFVSTANQSMFPISWRLADNTWRSLSVADAHAVWAALQTHIARLFAKFAAHESAINALTTLADVQAYDVTTGW